MWLVVSGDRATLTEMFGYIFRDLDTYWICKLNLREE